MGQRWPHAKEPTKARKKPVEALEEPNCSAVGYDRSSRPVPEIGLIPRRVKVQEAKRGKFRVRDTDIFWTVADTIIIVIHPDRQDGHK